jgi:hypothetical protein
MEGETTVTKPRKKKAAARWAMFEQVTKEELQGGIIEDVFRIAVDGAKSEKAAREAGEAAQISGRVLLACVHRDGQATPRTQTEIVWKK